MQFFVDKKKPHAQFLQIYDEDYHRDCRFTGIFSFCHYPVHSISPLCISELSFYRYSIFFILLSLSFFITLFFLLFRRTTKLRSRDSDCMFFTALTILSGLV